VGVELDAGFAAVFGVDVAHGVRACTDRKR